MFPVVRAAGIGRQVYVGVDQAGQDVFTREINNCRCIGQFFCPGRKDFGYPAFADKDGLVPKGRPVVGINDRGIGEGQRTRGILRLAMAIKKDQQG